MRRLTTSLLALSTALALSACGEARPIAVTPPTHECGEQRPRAAKNGHDLWLACGENVAEGQWRDFQCGVGYHAVATLGAVKNAIYVRCRGGQLGGRVEFDG